MKHEADYEDGCTAHDPTVVFTTQPPPWRSAHRRIQPYPERVDAELAELRRRVAALEAFARYFHDQ